MENANDSWPQLAADWVVHARDQRLPPALNEALVAATAAQIEELLELLLTITDLLGDETDQAESPESETSQVESELDQTPDSDVAPTRASSPAMVRLRVLLQATAARTLRLRLENETQNGSTQTDAIEAANAGQSNWIVTPELLSDLAAELMDLSPTAAAHCLQILAAQGDSHSLTVMGEFLKQSGLDDEPSVAVALSPLFQWAPAGLAHFYQVMGEDVWRWQLLGPLLDLAGHSLRKGKLAQHPLAANAPRLRQLLSDTVGRLSRLEENPTQFGNDVATIQRVLSNAIALTVSLCDTLGLINDRQAEGQLNQALGLSHRRIQTEAAGALARLGFANGKQRLLELVNDPASRLRALAYVEELDIEEPQLAQWREPVALAEAEVVSWLADPQRFGVPPAELEIIDQRTQYWPSYEEPQQCVLFRFTYHFAAGELSNLIIAGPLVYAFQTDLRDFDLDDVYAMFAGWHAEHEDIYEVPTARFNTAQLDEAQRLLDEPTNDGIEELQPLALTFFFGERAVLAVGTRDDRQWCVISDGLETLAYPMDNRPTSITPDLVLAIYRGRKLLRTFNP